MSKKPRQSQLMRRINMETWVPDHDELVHRINPTFRETNREEPLKWPKKPE